jgi:adenosylmethionine-8-amino-7-oxononanoate aminotransferase
VIVQTALAALDALGNSQYNQNILPDGTLRELWPQEGITSMSHNPAVERVVPLGTVLAVEMKVPEGAGGYASDTARAVASRMRRMGAYTRPLGNVAYVMCTPTTSEGDAHWLMHQLEACLMEAGEAHASSQSEKMHASA